MNDVIRDRSGIERKSYRRIDPNAGIVVTDRVQLPKCC
jgi:hypothetical protein